MYRSKILLPCNLIYLNQMKFSKIFQTHISSDITYTMSKNLFLTMQYSAKNKRLSQYI